MPGADNVENLMYVCNVFYYVHFYETWLNEATKYSSIIIMINRDRNLHVILHYVNY